ncbi:ligand-binding sensor domain-containing protein [Flavilitoribacter nigricans]|nr:two-component regulator propeller domain-containing protein [Flavilitoribacter nigricans]
MLRISCWILTGLFPISLLIFSCNGQAQSPSTTEPEPVSETKIPKYYELSDAVRCAFLDQDGIMWFGTNNEGLYRLEDSVFTQYTVEDGLCSNYISCIEADDRGDLWFGTDAGLCRYNGQTFTPVPIPWDGNEDLWGPGMNANLVLCLLNDQKGLLWLGTWGNGVHRFDPRRETDTGTYEFSSYLQDQGSLYEDSLHRNVIQSMLEDREGNIWLTSMSHGGVSRYDGKTFTQFTMEDGLSDDMVFSCLEDHEGNIWLGMLGNRAGTLQKYDGRSFTEFREVDGLCSRNIINMFEDRTGKLWLGSGRGELCIYNPNAAGELKFSAFTNADGKTFNKIRFITEDASGNIWFGGNYGQLYHYDGHTLNDFTQKGS